MFSIDHGELNDRVVYAEFDAPIKVGPDNPHTHNPWCGAFCCAYCGANYHQ
jgi:hypothetical protein